MTDTTPFLPTEISQITKETMTNLLDVNYPGTKVTRLTIGEILRGSATKVRLLLDYNDRGHKWGLPPTMWVKTGFEDHGLVDEAYRREVWFYQHLSSQLGGSIPKSYFAGCNDQQALILMEDLLARNVLFRNATHPGNLDQVKHLLSNLAAVHGALWESDRLESLAGERPGSSGPVGQHLAHS